MKEKGNLQFSYEGERFKIGKNYDEIYQTYRTGSYTCYDLSFGKRKSRWVNNQLADSTENR